MRSNPPLKGVASPLPPQTIEAVANISSAQLVEKLFDQSMVKASGSALGLHQVNAFAETAKIYDNGRGIHNAIVMGNTAAFDPKEYPSGFVCNFNVNAAVDPISLSSDSFQAMVLCKVINGKTKAQTPGDDYFKAKLASLDDAASQYTSTPISNGVRSDLNYDQDHWTAEMGKSGACGVLRRRRGNRSNDYYVYARSSADTLANDVIKMVANAKEAGTPMTWNDFLRSKPLAYWKNATMRNACRLAHAVSAKLDVCIETINEDGTYTLDDNQAERVTALPTHSQFISSLAFSHDHRNQLFATQYSQCAPPATGVAGADNIHFVSVSPYHGLVGVKMPAGRAFPGIALPTTTGRRVNASAVIKQPIGEDDVDAISTQYTWEGKPKDKLDAKSINDRLHPEAYRAFDAPFIEANFVSQGWKKEMGTEPFDPVIMKVATRKARPL